MRIDSIPPKDLLRQYTHIRETKPAPAAAPGADRAELTEGAKMFSNALKEAMDMMDVRSPEELAHINQVAGQIRNDTYSVPGVKVARKILGK
ncbi:MAG: flagellar biosynthesis anti-sigma factor FlgM [Christensenellales bacterium]